MFQQFLEETSKGLTLSIKKKKGIDFLEQVDVENFHKQISSVTNANYL